jgi:diguanylate cyclase (GGDEF)-like protein
MRLGARVAVWWLREGWARLPIGVRFMWLLLGVMVGLMTLLLGVGYRLLQRSLEAQQQLVQRQRLEAVVSALERELAALLRQVQDYTVWDDAHTAISQRDAPWIRRNITEWLPQQFHYDFAVVVDAQGAWAAHTAGDWAWLRQTAPFQRAMRGVSSAGLHRRGETIYLLAAAPFADEAWSRPPAGALVVGRALDATLLRRISQSAGHMGAVQLEAVVAFSDADRQLTLRKMLGQSVQEDSDPLLQVPPASRGNQAPARLLSRNGGSQAPERFPSRSGESRAPERFPLRSGGSQAPERFPSRSGGNLKEGGDTLPSIAYLLHDSAGQPVAWLMVEPPRAEQAWLLNALCLAKQYLFVFGGALALIASLTMVLLLQSHLRRFSVVIQRLASGDWGARIAYPARDEFGYLARAFNQMAYQLQQAFEAQEQQREELLAQNEELERVHAQLQQAHQELATLNAELLEANRALAQAAVTDGLTGLKNHRAFQESLHSAAQMAERLQQPLSLIMFDIDHFKQFNDTFGHPAGDELLRQVAQVLRESARAYDVAARYGGEEFALLLPNTTLEQAVQVAERLRQQIRAIENPHAPVSASFGVATYRRGTPPATLVYEADAALYRAKRNGRDQVCVYQPEAA